MLLICSRALRSGEMVLWDFKFFAYFIMWVIWMAVVVSFVVLACGCYIIQKKRQRAIKNALKRLEEIEEARTDLVNISTQESADYNKMMAEQIVVND